MSRWLLSILPVAAIGLVVLAFAFGGRLGRTDPELRPTPLLTRRNPPELPRGPEPAPAGAAVEVPRRPAPPPEDARLLAARVLELEAAERRVSGRVLDAEGRPLAGAELGLRRLSRPLLDALATGAVLDRSLSGPDGSFEFAVPLDLSGTYVVEAALLGRAGARSAEILGRDPGSWTVVLVLEEGLVLTGRLRSSRGVPLQGLVRVHDLGRSERPPAPDLEASAGSHADGSFRVEGLRPGPKMVVATAPGHAERIVSPWELRPAEERRIEIELVPGRRLRGKVQGLSRPTGLLVAARSLVPGGAPTFVRSGAGVQSQVSGAGTGGEVWTARTDAEGRFEFEGLPHVALRLSVADDMGAPLAEAEAAADAEELDLAVRGGSGIEGRVVDARSGAPIESFAVVPLRDPSPLAPLDSGGVLRRDPEGRFEIPVRGGGAWYVAAEAPGHARAVAGPFELGRDEWRRGVELALPQATLLLGRVLDEQGVPVGGARILVRELGQAQTGAARAEAGPVRARAARSEADGSFLVPDLAAGSVHLEVRHEEFAPLASGPHPLPEGTTFRIPDLQLVRGGSIRGMVRTRAGSPDALALVSIVPEGIVGESAVVPTDGQGRFGCSGLAPGAYRVSVIQAEGRLLVLEAGTPLVRTASVGPGTRAELEFRLP
jgi:hypothetical protein